MFNFQKLIVYQRATEFLALAMIVVDAVPRGNSAVSDQLKRAALSIPLNIAEGQGKRSRTDASRFYSIARGSAMECAAIVDAALILRVITEERAGEGQQLLLEITRMLSALMKA